MDKSSKEKRSKFTPVVDYRKLRPNNILSSEYRHLLYLLFWPIFVVVFYYIELFYPVEYYHPIYCFADDLIPFCEIFVIPYMFWFLFVFLMHIYTLFYDIDGFKKMIKFIIITYSAAIITFLVFPSCQELRPASFESENVLTATMQGVYEMDTNTNVCPSIHVIGSLAVMFAALDSKTIKSKAVKVSVVLIAVLICLSTVFLKQHSVIDVVAALPVCGIAYYICYVYKSKKKNSGFVKSENSAAM